MNGDNANGGAILSNGGGINIAGSSFTGNHASSNGGAISSSGSINIVGTSFIGNKADGNGGAIEITGGGSKLTLAASNFNGNIATGSGGALSVSAAADISDVIFAGNIATGDATHGGGAIFNNGSSGGSKLTIIRSSFGGNLSPQGSGGALFNGSQATALVSDSSFNGNIAGTPIANDRFGGAIYNQSQAQLALNRVTMLNNVAGGSGGALANDKGTAIVTNTSFTANAASSKGGGVFNFDSQQGGANPSTVTLRNATFSTNAAALGGGGIFNDFDQRPVRGGDDRQYDRRQQRQRRRQLRRHDRLAWPQPRRRQHLCAEQARRPEQRQRQARHPVLQRRPAGLAADPEA